MISTLICDIIEKTRAKRVKIFAHRTVVHIEDSLIGVLPLNWVAPSFLNTSSQVKKVGHRERERETAKRASGRVRSNIKVIQVIHGYLERSVDPNFPSPRCHRSLSRLQRCIYLRSLSSFLFCFVLFCFLCFVFGYRPSMKFDHLCFLIPKFVLLLLLVYFALPCG